MKESGDAIAAREAFAEIGEVVAGTKPARRSAEEVTLFKYWGWRWRTWRRRSRAIVSPRWWRLTDRR